MCFDQELLGNIQDEYNWNLNWQLNAFITDTVWNSP